MRIALLAVLLLVPSISTAESLSSCPQSEAPSFFGSLQNIFDHAWNPFAGRWCSKGSGDQVGWAKRAGPESNDVTARFRSLQDAVTSGEGAGALPADAADYTYLVVKGLYGNQMAGYMDANVDRLTDLGLNASKVDLDTEAGVEENAAVIRDAILKASAGGKKVVLIGHSKGGVDSTAALSLYPELAPHVRALIAIQAPFGGTPIASDIQGCPALKSLTDDLVSNVFGGSPKSMVDLTYEARQAFLAAHPYPSGIPTVSVATSRTPELSSVMWKPALYMKARYGIPTDGLVPADDAEIPGSDVVRLDDMDHAEGGLVGIPGFRNYDPADVTESLVRLALGR